jgi:hypothetical protein
MINVLAVRYQSVVTLVIVVKCILAVLNKIIRVNVQSEHKDDDSNN